jgi:hypothetical protein
MGSRRRRKSAIQSDLDTEGFSPRRGWKYFLIGLVVGPIMVGMSALGGASISLLAAAAFAFGIAALAGVIGMFTENIPS